MRSMMRYAYINSKPTLRNGNKMSTVKFANALVQNLSIFDSTGYDRMGSYAERFLSVLAEDGDLTPLVAEYNSEIRGIINNVEWIRPESFMKANHLAALTTRWVDGVNREAAEVELISFLKG